MCTTLRQPSHDQRTHFRDALVITIDMNDTKSMMQRRARDQQIGNGSAMPHSVMVRQVALQFSGAIENIRWRRNDLETLVQFHLQSVVIACGTRRIQLFELPDGTKKK